MSHGQAEAGTIEVVDGAGDSVTVARISTDVLRWMTRLPERIEQVRARLPSYRDWVALLDGEPVGEAACMVPPDMKESTAAYGEICVLPDARRRGVGTALFDHVSAYCRSLGKSELETHTFEDDPDGVAFGERRGFTCIMRQRSLRLFLAECPPPSVDPPEGVTLTTLAERPDLVRDVWEVAAEAWPDIPFDGDAPLHPGEFEEFEALSLTGPKFIPDATFVALEDGETVGYAQLVWHDHSHAIGRHGMLAVRRAARGRGIAGALKAAQIAWALEHGLTELRTENEERNAPMRAVNAKYPYQPLPDGLVLRGPLAPAPA